MTETLKNATGKITRTFLASFLFKQPSVCQFSDRSLTNSKKNVENRSEIHSELMMQTLLLDIKFRNVYKTHQT